MGILYCYYIYAILKVDRKGGDEMKTDQEHWLESPNPQEEVPGGRRPSSGGSLLPVGVEGEDEDRSAEDDPALD